MTDRLQEESSRLSPHSRTVELHVFDPNGDVILLFPERERTNKHGVITESEVRMVVSSKHLILASSKFAKMLEPIGVLNATLRRYGRLEIPLPEDNPDTFLILCNIIHGHNACVPREVSTETMDQVGSMAEKYGMEESIEVYFEMWAIYKARIRT